MAADQHAGADQGGFYLMLLRAPIGAKISLSICSVTSGPMLPTAIAQLIQYSLQVPADGNGHYGHKSLTHRRQFASVSESLPYLSTSMCALQRFTVVCWEISNAKKSIESRIRVAGLLIPISSLRHPPLESECLQTIREYNKIGRIDGLLLGHNCSDCGAKR